MVSVVDEDGIEYSHVIGSVDNTHVVRDFEINKNMLNKKYFLNIKFNDIIYTTELVIK